MTLSLIVSRRARIGANDCSTIFDSPKAASPSFRNLLDNENRCVSACQVAHALHGAEQPVYGRFGSIQ